MGRNRFLIVLGSICLLVVVPFSFLLLNERANARDAERLLHMRAVQQSYQEVFLSTGSFRSVQFPDVQDPGTFSYDATETPSERTFRVSFRLERSHDGLSAGEHVLTEKGIQ